MPFPLEFLDDGRGVFEAGIGHVTGSEIIAATQAILAAGDKTSKLVYALVDLSQATNITVTADEMVMKTSLNKRFARLVRAAVVAIVAPTELQFGVARMWEGMVQATEWTTQVFRTRTEAETWLRSELWARMQFEPTFQATAGGFDIAQDPMRA